MTHSFRSSSKKERTGSGERGGKRREKGLDSCKCENTSFFSSIGSEKRREMTRQQKKSVTYLNQIEKYY